MQVVEGEKNVQTTLGETLPSRIADLQRSGQYYPNISNFRVVWFPELCNNGEASLKLPSLGAHP